VCPIFSLTPIYLLVVGFMATLFRFLADGPLSGLIHHASRNCGSNGWKNILYVNNLVNATMENMVTAFSKLLQLLLANSPQCVSTFPFPVPSGFLVLCNRDAIPSTLSAHHLYFMEILQNRFRITDCPYLGINRSPRNLNL